MSAAGPPGNAASVPPPEPHGSPGDPGPVHPIDYAILATGVLSAVFSLFHYYAYRGKGAAVAEICAHFDQVPPSFKAEADAVCYGVTTSAWHGLFGWFGALLALLGAVAVAAGLFAPHLRLPAPAHLIGLAAFGLAAVSTLLALAVVPDYDGGGPNYGASVAESHGFAYWVVLILVVTGAVLCFERLQQTRTTGTFPRV